MCQRSTSTFENSRECTALEMPEKGNNRAVRLVDKAVIPSGLRLGRSEVFRSLREYLRAQSKGHQTIDRLEERGAERERARQSSLKEPEKVTVNQMNIGTVSKATLGKRLTDGMEYIIIGFF